MSLQIAAPLSRYRNAVLADSPVSYWRCNEALGASTAVDAQGVISGTYSANIANGLGRQGPTPGDSTAGAIGMAYAGSTYGVIFGSTSAFNVGPPATVEFWVMTTTTANAQPVGLGNTSAPFNGYSVGINQGAGAGKIVIWDSNTQTWVASSVTINDGAWHHIVVVFSGTTATIYKDGASAGTATLSAIPSPWTGSGMKLLECSTQQSPLYMSEVAFYNGALSATRIAVHYNAALSNALPDRIKLLTPSVAWESAAVQEPSLWWDGSQWNMIYTGGFATTALGYATCTSDPTVPGNWTKYASNPIISGNVARGSIFLDSGTLYLFYAANTTTSNMSVVSGTDALHLGTPSTALSTTGTATGMANMWVVKNGSTYYMLFESRLSGGRWAMGYATASTPAGPYTIQTFPITSLDLNGSTGSTGGPWFTLNGSTYELWYHGSSIAEFLPTRIYRSTSTDLVNWTTPVLKTVPAASEEYDQTADPMLVIPGSAGAPSSGPAYALWSGIDNVNSTADIFIARPSAMPVAA